VELTGLRGLPATGNTLLVVESEAKANVIANRRKE